MTRHPRVLSLAGGILAAAGFAAAGLATLTAPVHADSPLHPEVELLDADGRPVLASAAPVSARRTCGACHDTDFIAAHSDHSLLGFDQAGGTLREAHALDPATGRPAPAGWTAAPGTVEMNCFLCHLGKPAHDRRTAALAAGSFAWATTATLADTGLVEPDGAGGWRYIRSAFDVDGTVGRERLRLGDPTDAHCGACHFEAGATKAPFAASGTWAPRDALAGGQVFHPQRISDSALNLRGKSSLDRSWDVHAARLVSCVDCHHAPDNPARVSAAPRAGPDHLSQDARRSGVGDYLKRPSHRFTSGGLSGCTDCHSVRESHGRWLPHVDRHLASMACTVCHVPRVTAPALKQIDGTVPGADGGPGITWRGIEGPIDDPRSVVTGYEPVLLPQGGAERAPLAPYNLVTTWYWASGSPERPVSASDLLAASRDEDGGVHPDLLRALDADGDGRLGAGERRLTTPGHVAAVAGRLEAAGIERPRIRGVVEPTLVSHGVVAGDGATRACEVCHAPSSRVARPFEVAAHVPPGATAVLAEDADVRWAGPRVIAEGGALRYEPRPTEAGRYVLGHDRAGLLDRLGLLAVVGAVLAAVVHGGLRWRASARRGKVS